MKKVIKIVGIVLGVLIVGIGGFVGYVAVVGKAIFDPPATPKLTIQATPALIKRGEVISQLQCAACHADKDNRLAGRHMAEVPGTFGTIYSKNITNDPDKGIGKWTDGELMYFLRTSIRPDGTTGGVMPAYPLLADEDIKAVIAYLRSDSYAVQPVKTELPPAEYSLFFNLLTHTVLQPVAYPQAVIPFPDSTNELAFGAYTANAVNDCYACHSASPFEKDLLVPEKTKGFYGGGFEVVDDQGKPLYTANITFDEQTGIGGKYTKEQFIRAIKQGVRPDGSVLRYPMMPRPALTDKEAGAIYTYLKTIPKLHNDIAQKAAENAVATK